MKVQTLIEVLAPKQSTTDLDAALERFAKRYETTLAAGCAVSIPDNPMGVLRFQAVELITELGLSVPAGRVLAHLNTCHTMENLDQTIEATAAAGIGDLLLVTGDGSERLSKLDPAILGFDSKSATSVELLRYVHREYPGTFRTGVAFNPYEPQDHELVKLRRKLDAGASFIITQPVIGMDKRLATLPQFGVPLFVGAWMSKRLDLLANCIGGALEEHSGYDPEANLAALHSLYPAFGLYVSMLKPESQLAALEELLARHESDHRKAAEAATQFVRVRRG